MIFIPNQDQIIYIFDLSTKYKGDGSSNGKEGEDEGGEGTVGHKQSFHLPEKILGG